MNKLDRINQDWRRIEKIEKRITLDDIRYLLKRLEASEHRITNNDQLSREIAKIRKAHNKLYFENNELRKKLREAGSVYLPKEFGQIVPLHHPEVR